MNRRGFLHGSGLAATALALGRPSLAQPAATDCAGAPALGVQLFTVRDLLRSDAAGTLAALGAMGLAEVEPFGLGGATDGSTELMGLRPAEFAAVLERSGLRAPLAQVDGDLENAEAVADVAHAIGAEALVMALAPEFVDARGRMIGARSLEQLDRLGARLDRLGAELRGLGLAFGYHNHHVEFVPVEGRVPFDYLMERTDPELVKLELDVGWLAAAGADPVEYLERYAGRAIACHMKDFDGLAGPPPEDVGDVAAHQARLVEPGAGSVDFPAVLDVMRAAGIRHAFIEIDVTADPLAAVEAGHRHLRTLRGC